MAILLTKTLQSVEYDLYIMVVDYIFFSSMNKAMVTVNVWESQGHKTDKFVPMIVRMEDVYGDSTIDLPPEDSSGIADITLLMNYSHQYLLDNVAWYSGGTLI